MLCHDTGCKPLLPSANIWWLFGDLTTVVLQKIDGSPWDGSAIAQEFAGEILRRIGREPHVPLGAFVDRASGTRAAHSGAHPTRTNGVHPNFGNATASCEVTPFSAVLEMQ